MSIELLKSQKSWYPPRDVSHHTQNLFTDFKYLLIVTQLGLFVKHLNPILSKDRVKVTSVICMSRAVKNGSNP